MPSCSSSTCTTSSTSRECRAIVNVSASTRDTLCALNSIPVVPTYPAIAESASRVQARGPGRVNLMGEHTDYNGGLALPFAIDRGVTVTAEPAARYTAHALDLGEHDEFERPARATGWRAFVRGMVAELEADGYAVRPCRLTIEGDLERGSGLSSSAALSTALALA